MVPLREDSLRRGVRVRGAVAVRSTLPMEAKKRKRTEGVFRDKVNADCKRGRAAEGDVVAFIDDVIEESAKKEDVVQGYPFYNFEVCTNFITDSENRRDPETVESSVKIDDDRIVSGLPSDTSEATGFTNENVSVPLSVPEIPINSSPLETNDARNLLPSDDSPNDSDVGTNNDRMATETTAYPNENECDETNDGVVSDSNVEGASPKTTDDQEAKEGRVSPVSSEINPQMVNIQMDTLKVCDTLDVDCLKTDEGVDLGKVDFACEIDKLTAIKHDIKTKDTIFATDVTKETKPIIPIDKSPYCKNGNRVAPFPVSKKPNNKKWKRKFRKFRFYEDDRIDIWIMNDSFTSFSS